jgi:sterol-4alpha-carboxylate 3-dehydrogenase (decarboxylating)
MLQRELGDRSTKSIVKIPFWLGLVMAWFIEVWCSVTATKSQFTVYVVKFSCLPQWYRIEKAKKLLGFKPKVSLEEGVRRSARVSLNSYKKFNSICLSTTY